MSKLHIADRDGYVSQDYKHLRWLHPSRGHLRYGSSEWGDEEVRASQIGQILSQNINKIKENCIDINKKDPKNT